MYIPKHFAEDDPGTLSSVIKSASFASLITSNNGVPYATHLPLSLDTRNGDHGTILGHVARANDHWEQFDGETTALAIFTGINAYIGPNWYSSDNMVPTWHYMTVHAYGKPRVKKNPDDVLNILERLTADHESDASGNWTMDKMDPKILRGMLKGIVAFEMPIDRIEGKAKLGQNKKRGDRLGAIDGLNQTGESTSQKVASEMERRLKE